MRVVSVRPTASAPPWSRRFAKPAPVLPSTPARPSACPIPLDHDPAAFIAVAKRALGGIDVLVVSARPVRNKPALEVSRGGISRILEHDLVEPPLHDRSGKAHGRTRPWPHHRLRFDVRENRTASQCRPFAAAKGGLLALVRVLAAELAEHGVTVNGIATALFEPQVAAMSEEKRTALRRGIPSAVWPARRGRACRSVPCFRQGGFVTGECLNLSRRTFMD